MPKRSLARIALGLLICLALATAAHAQVHVRGYFRSDGTYVSAHLRTYPDGNPYNNYSFPGNFNPNGGSITLGDPVSYLQRYYSARRSSFAASDRPLPPGAASTLRPAELDALLPLPDWVPPEEFERSRAFCRSMWMDNPRNLVDCDFYQFRALRALVLPDYSSLPRELLARAQQYCESVFHDDRAAFYDCLNQQVLTHQAPAQSDQRRRHERN